MGRGRESRGRATHQNSEPDLTLEEPRHWHVTVTVAGEQVEPLLLRSALMRFAHERPFLSSLSFVTDGAEFSFWDEGTSMAEVTAGALGIWAEHRESATLPDWEVVGLQVLDREAYRTRRDLSSPLPGAQEIRLQL